MCISLADKAYNSVVLAVNGSQKHLLLCSIFEGTKFQINKIRPLLNIVISKKSLDSCLIHSSSRNSL